MSTTEPPPLQFDPHRGSFALPLPGTVVAASALMWLHFALALCMPASFAAVWILRLSDVEGGPIESSEARYFGLFAGLSLLCVAAFLTLVGILAVKLLRGRRWARITTLVLNGLVIVVMLMMLVIPITTFLAIAHEGAIALCLCAPSARAWFTNPRNESEDPLVAACEESRD